MIGGVVPEGEQDFVDSAPEDFKCAENPVQSPAGKLVLFGQDHRAEGVGKDVGVGYCAGYADPSQYAQPCFFDCEVEREPIPWTHQA
jgi:hypothetical protein